MEFWAFITMAATCVIAFYAWQNHKLAKAIQKNEDEFKQQVTDLYKAIVISNLITPDSSEGSAKLDSMIRAFNQKYDQVKEGRPLFS